MFIFNYQFVIATFFTLYYLYIIYIFKNIFIKLYVYKKLFEDAYTATKYAKKIAIHLY